MTVLYAILGIVGFFLGIVLLVLTINFLINGTEFFKLYIKNNTKENKKNLHDENCQCKECKNNRLIEWENKE